MIDVPDKLDEEQRAAVDALSKVFNGDPRARLFPSRTASAAAEAAES